MLEPRGRVDKELIVEMSLGHFAGFILAVGSVCFCLMSL